VICVGMCAPTASALMSPPTSSPVREQPATIHSATRRASLPTGGPTTLPQRGPTREPFATVPTGIPAGCMNSRSTLRNGQVVRGPSSRRTYKAWSAPVRTARRSTIGAPHARKPGNVPAKLGNEEGRHPAFPLVTAF
jgi:hypothetical protein